MVVDSELLLDADAAGYHRVAAVARGDRGGCGSSGGGGWLLLFLLVDLPLFGTTVLKPDLYLSL